MIRDFYQNEYLDYHHRTFHIDPSSFLEPLTSRLPTGSVILDVGCGSGRDLLWLSKRGYRVIGLDRSSKLAALAKANSSAPIIVADFEVVDFSTFSVDAIILIGALVHISPARFATAFHNITAALKKDGYTLLTLKEGKGSGTDRYGRVFFYWEQGSLEELFSRFGMQKIEFFRQVSLIDQSDIWLTYLLRKNA